MDVNTFTSNLHELNGDSPAAPPPDNINVTLRPHQLTLLHRCKQLEDGEVSIELPRMPNNFHTSNSTTNIACRIRTRIGIIADKVGSGKSNVILSLIASDSDQPTMTSNFASTFTYGMNNIIMTVEQQKRMSNINVIVIPHNLVNQWTGYIKDFYKQPIKYIIVSKSKHIEMLTPENLSEYRLIVVTTTFYPRLVAMFARAHIQVKRTMYDEVDSVNVSTSDHIDSAFHWFVTASYMNLLHPRGHGRYDRSINRYVVIAEGMRTGGFIKTLFCSLYSSVTNSTSGAHSRPIANLIIAKNDDGFVDNSISLPPIDYRHIKCKTPRAINILEGIVDRHVIQCLNAGDVESAIHFINPSHRSTEDNIISILLEKYTKSLHNVNTMVDYVTNHMQYDTEQQRVVEVERLQKKREEFNNKIASITKRIKDSELCCICYENIANKTIVNCCMNSYCFTCISTWVSQRHTCPLCKESLDLEKFYIIRDTDEAGAAASTVVPRQDDAPHESYDKIQNLECVIKQISKDNPNNKLLIFSMNEGIFDKLQDILNNMGRSFKMLKGTNMSIAKTVESYKNGELNTLLVNPENYGSGLNLENTTDMIMLHKFDTEIDKQVIGRAQRYGRRSPLRVWYLLYNNEMSSTPRQTTTHS